MKYDLGAGAVSPEGFTPLGNINGTTIFPLPVADGSADVIRASHVLEHFESAKIAEVLAEWVRALRPGGVLRIAVPDFEKIAVNYLSGVQQPTEGYVLGGQTDGADFHKAMFDRAHLVKLLAGAGLMLIREWKSELEDCAALPISLNLEGTKPYIGGMRVSAVMSVPRLGFMDNMFAAFETLPSLNIKVRRHTGAYWGQCMERVIEQTVEEDAPDAILTLDYDSVFKKKDASMLIQLMCCNPEADAIAAVQASRGKNSALFTVHNKSEDKGPVNVNRDFFAPDMSKVATAHFGLTLFRAEHFKSLEHPWFLDVPDADGKWGDTRRDADVDFWRKWEMAGHSLFLANRVAIGHLELAVLWPGEDMTVISQPISDWRNSGAPDAVWK